MRLPIEVLTIIAEFAGNDARHINQHFKDIVENRCSRLITEAMRFNLKKARDSDEHPGVFQRHCLRSLCFDMGNALMRDVLINGQYTFASMGFRETSDPRYSQDEETSEYIFECLKSNQVLSTIADIDYQTLVESAITALNRYYDYLSSLSLIELINHIHRDAIPYASWRIFRAV